MSKKKKKRNKKQTSHGASKTQHWQYRMMGEEFGPYTANQMQALAQKGTLTEDMHVRRVGDTSWETAASQPVLFDPPTETANEIPDSASTNQGIGRLGYFLLTCLTNFIQYMLFTVIVVASIGADLNLQSLIRVVGGMTLAVVLVGLAVNLAIIAMRLTNLGYRKRLCLLALVPIANVCLGYWCICCPADYAQHKRLDDAGKVILGIFVTTIILISCMLLIEIVVSGS